MTEAVVGRFIVEVEAGSAAGGQAAGDEIASWLTPEWVAALLEDCLADLPEPPGTLQIETLSVDLGQFPSGAGADEIYRRAKAHITDQLRPLFAGAMPTDAGLPGAPTAPAVAVTALGNFLRYGMLDWSADADKPVSEIVAAAIDADGAGATRLLRQALSDPAAARRLADHLPPAMWAQVLALVAPAAGRALAVVGELLSGLHAASAFSGQSAATVTMALRAAALRAAAEAGQSQWSASASASAVLRLAASLLAVDGAALTQGAAARISRNRTLRVRGDGTPAIEEVEEAIVALAETAQRSPIGGIATGAQAEAIAGARRFLATGVALAGEAGDSPVAEGALRQSLRHWAGGGAGAAAARERLTGPLASDASRMAAAARIFRLFPEREAARIAAWLGLPVPPPGERLAPPPWLAGQAEMGSSREAGTQDEPVDAAGDDAHEPQDTGDIALFWFLMEHGALPWWARDLAVHSIDRWIADLIDQRAGEVAVSLHSMTEHRRALLIERMAARLALVPLAALAAAARPGLSAELRNWLGYAPAIQDLARQVSVGGGNADAGKGADGAGGAGAVGGPALTADRILQALAAVLVGRLFDPHAPRLEWEALRQALTESAARRLGISVDALTRLFEGEPHGRELATPGALPEEPGRADPDDTAQQHPPREPPGSAEDEETAAGDLAVLRQFISAAENQEDPIAETVAILSDRNRRQRAAAQLSPEQIDALVARFIAREDRPRVRLLNELGPAVSRTLPAVTDAQWQARAVEAVFDLLARIVGGEGAVEMTGELMLSRLLREQSIRYRRGLLEHVQAVLREALEAHGVSQEAVALLQRVEAALPGDSAAAHPSADVLPRGGRGDVLSETELQEAELHPGLGEADSPLSRLGDTARPVPDPAALADDFLALPRDSEAARVAGTHIRLLLANPLQRDAFAALVSPATLEQMVQQLGGAEAGFPITAVRDLAALIGAVAPGAGSTDWVLGVSADMLRPVSDAAAVPPDAESQLRHWLQALSRDEGLDYAETVRGLAAEASQAGNLPNAVMAALRNLARFAEADAPAAEAAKPDDAPDSASPAETADGEPPAPSGPAEPEEQMPTPDAPPRSQARLDEGENLPEGGKERVSALPETTPEQTGTDGLSRGQADGHAPLRGVRVPILGEVRG